jgi:nucleoside 2-deoxyribosyltransferase
LQHGKITFKGLNHLHEIENKGILSNKCFVAMSFDGNKNNRLDAIKIACAAYQFDAFVVDDYYETGNQTIDSKIITAIKSSNFCIADFTGINQGAYMEAGFAMGRNMKVIFTCEKKDFETNKKHFDVNHYPFLCYESYGDLTEQLKSRIGAYIK